MMRKSFGLAVCVMILGVVAPAPAHAQAEIKVNDDVNLKFGVLAQVWGDTVNPESGPSTNNLFIRRLRLISGGQVAKNVTYFVETDSPNLGRVLPTGKNITPSVIVQDAWVTFKAADAFSVEGGLMFVPFSRNGLQSAAALLPIDYGAFTFNDSSPEESSTGRDTGFQARGYLGGNRLEYRIGAFAGVRNDLSDNPFRYVGRVQYNFFDPEVAFFYTGTYLGKKRVLAVGGAFQAQSDYHAYDADVFFDHPFGPGAITAQFDYTHFDGGTTLPTLRKQNDLLVEAGYLIQALKLTPVLQFARQNISDGLPGDQWRTSVGANYWWAAQNASIKAAYTRISPTGGVKQNEFTVQLQLFYF
jgi:hypothetical protein